MVLAPLLFIACNQTPVIAPTEGTEDIVRTGTRPIVEAVDSARDTAVASTGRTGETGTTSTPFEPEVDCFNQLDDDKDGLIDCLDPDCSFEADCVTEICNDQQDNEGDGLIDCLDPDCASDALCDTSCADVVLSGPLPITERGSTRGAGNTTSPTCASSNADDVSFAFIAPQSGRYTFSTAGSAYDTTLYLYSGCRGREIACNDDANGTLQSQVTNTLPVGAVVIAVVDGYSSSSGNFQLSVSY